VDFLIETISDAIRTTGKIGDGRVFVYPVVDVIRVRTTERGSGAV